MVLSNSVASCFLIEQFSISSPKFTCFPNNLHKFSELFDSLLQNYANCLNFVWQGTQETASSLNDFSNYSIIIFTFRLLFRETFCSSNTSFKHYNLIDLVDGGGEEGEEIVITLKTLLIIDVSRLGFSKLILEIINGGVGRSTTIK